MTVESDLDKGLTKGPSPTSKLKRWYRVVRKILRLDDYVRRHLLGSRLRRRLDVPRGTTTEPVEEVRVKSV